MNVVLDVLLDRRPHVGAASDVWTAVETGRVQGFLSAHGITTVHYLNTREVGARAARETTDAVTAAAAQRARCAAIVTRNPRDFKRSPVRVLAPVEAAAWLGVTGSSMA